MQKNKLFIKVSIYSIKAVYIIDNAFPSVPTAHFVILLHTSDTLHTRSLHTSCILLLTQSFHLIFLPEQCSCFLTATFNSSKQKSSLNSYKREWMLSLTSNQWEVPGLSFFFFCRKNQVPLLCSRCHFGPIRFFFY